MNKKTNYMEWLRRGLIVVLIIIFVTSLYKFVTKYYQYKKGIDAAKTASFLAGLTEKTKTKTDNDIFNVDMDKLKDLNLSKLQETNSDVIGWILIPDTNVNYPILQTDNNDYYLTYTWDKKYNWMGSIYMDAIDKRDFSDFHTIIYGHNVRNELMFSQLLNYKNKDFFRAHPMIYIFNGEKIMKYEIFAAFEADVEGHVFLSEIEDEISREVFINKSINSSNVKAKIKPTADSNIITLSTCTGRGHDTRWVVQAVRLKD